MACRALQIFATAGSLTLNRLRISNKGIISGSNFASETDNKPYAKTNKASTLTAEFINEQWFVGQWTLTDNGLLGGGHVQASDRSLLFQLHLTAAQRQVHNNGREKIVQKLFQNDGTGSEQFYCFKP